MPPTNYKGNLRNEEYEQEQKEKLVRKRITENSEHVSRRLLCQIGKPPRFVKMDCHYLYDGHYRCNLWVARDDPSGGESKHIDKSFFVTIAEDDIENYGVEMCIK